ncbi:MAG: hypothetical protein IT375_33005 [Polyangiaceae bacterium]|nr:hypothetical protein [Polyangiaceae bacterium]
MENYVTAFTEFVKRATPLVVGRAQRYLDVLAPVAAELRQCLGGVDLLHIAGVTGSENSYTSLIAWAFAPARGRKRALVSQRRWFQLCDMPTGVLESLPLDVREQYDTGAGVPDIVMFRGGVAVVVEAKTGSQEHITPAKKLQTKSYPAEVRRALELAGDPPVVFLTPNRRAASNQAAVLSSYVEVAAALAHANVTLPEDEWSPAVRSIVAHLIRHAVPAGSPVEGIVAELPTAGIAQRLPDILAAETLLPITRRDHD